MTILRVLEPFKDVWGRPGLALANIASVRPGMTVFETSAKQGTGIDQWLAYLASRRQAECHSG